MELMDGAVGIDDMSFSAPTEDDEELGSIPKKRQSNFNNDEDKALVLAWESVSLDPIAGTDQRMRTYWKRISDYYHRNVTSSIPRSFKSLQGRWSFIQESCSRWAGCVSNVDHAKPSGITEDMLLSDTNDMYKHRDPKHRSFQLYHCWALQKNNEKWINRDNEQLNPKKKAKSNSQDSDDDDAEEEANTPTTPVVQAKRPPGRRGEKDKQKNGGDAGVFKSAVEEIIANKSKVEEAKKLEKDMRWAEMKAMEERKVAIGEEKLRAFQEEVQTKKMEQEYKIMLTNTVGLDPEALQYLQLMKSQILASKLGGGASGHGFGSSNGDGSQS